MIQMHPTVSFENEMLQVVSDDDTLLRYDTKNACHVFPGVLHRAFSAFIFDKQGRVLIQKRSVQKKLWPGFWANSCCSHPRSDESMDSAVVRRVREELGLTLVPRFVYRFVYQAHYLNVGSEYELCSVYSAVCKDASTIVVNPHEIADWKFVEPDWLTSQLETFPELYSPWLHLEWAERAKF